MSAEVLLENYLSREGVWSLHVVRMGQAVERDGWLQRAPSFAWHTLETRAWVEEGLGMHHLHLCGQIQDVINLERPDGGRERACFWYAVGMSARVAILQAAERYYVATGKLPGRAIARQLPVGCPVDGNGTALPVAIQMLGLEMEIPIETADWAPRGYVVVMGEPTPGPSLQGGEKEGWERI